MKSLERPVGLKPLPLNPEMVPGYLDHLRERPPHRVHEPQLEKRLGVTDMSEKRWRLDPNTNQMIPETISEVGFSQNLWYLTLYFQGLKN
jgi:hypothetical protein